MNKSSAPRTRRVFSAEFKAKVALAALREETYADSLLESEPPAKRGDYQ